MRRVVLTILLTCSFVDSSVSFSDDRVSRLDEVNAKIEGLQAELDTFTESKEITEGELKKIQYTIKSLTDREVRIKKDLGKVKASKAEAENILREIQEKIHVVETLSTKRLQALYMLKGEQALVSVSHLNKASEFDKATVYLARIRAHDRQLIEDMRLLRVKRDTETGKLTQLQKQQTELLAQLELQRRELQLQAQSREKVLLDLKAQRKKLDETLLSLKAQALRLETVVRSLTGGSDEDDGATKTRDAPSEKILGFEGMGIGGKSYVVEPFRGKVIQKYGKQKGPEGVMKKGIEFGGSGPVVAIAEGRVAYLGKMPQLGSVVILDHGKRDYSLYGRLQNVSAKVGDTLSRGEVLGEAGKHDEQGRSFYFEIRRGGSPVDPQVVFEGKLGNR